MSLAELFFAKHPRRPVLSRFRRRRAHLPRTQRFQLEALEPRLLMSVAPVSELALQEIAIEPAAAVIQGTTTVLALTGDAAPASGAGTGGTFSSLGTPVLNDAGQAAFSASVSGSASTSGIFRSSGPGQVLALARQGEAVPASGAGIGGTFSGLQNPDLNDAGQAAFFANVTGSTSSQGIFRSSGPGQVLALARQGETAPDSGAGTGGTFLFIGNPVLNDAGQAAFFANVTDSTSSQGIFRSSGPGQVTTLARLGEAAPASGGQTAGTISSFGSMGFNDAGQAAFTASIGGTIPFDQGIFLSSGPGLVTALARAGEIAPASGGQIGGTLTALASGVVALNDAGQAAFVANVTNSTSNQGIFRSGGPGAVTALARIGETAPASGAATGGTFSGFGSPVLNDLGQAAFFAFINGAPSSTQGIFLSSGPGAVAALARVGQAAPDGNGTFSALNVLPRITEGGAILFSADLTGTLGGSTDDRGLFLADGLDLVQVAREGQALAGSTITNLFLSFNDVLTDRGQVAYRADLANGRQAIVLFTVPELHYRSTSSGPWDTSSNWQVSLIPGAVHDLFIDPLNGGMVTGPTQSTTVKSLTVGAQTSGTAILFLNGENLAVTNGLTIQNRGALELQLGGLTASSVINAGILTQLAGTTANFFFLTNNGSAQFNGQTTVGAGIENRGNLSIGSGGNLTTNGSASNVGTVILDNGTFDSPLNLFVNEVEGELTGRGTINADGFINRGTIETTGLLTLAQGGENYGRISIGAGETLSLTGSFISSGLIDLTNGTISAFPIFPLTNLLAGIIRGSGTIASSVTNQGLIHATGNGLLTINLSGGNEASGELQIDDGSALNATTAFTSAGVAVLKGASATLSGSGLMTNTGTVRGQGRITGPVTNNGVIRAEAGTLTLSNLSNTNHAAGRFEAGTGASLLFSQGLTSNAGAIALTGGQFDNNLRALTNQGRILGHGAVSTGGLTNATGGVIHFADGATDVFGTVTNNAILNVTNGTSTFFNAVTNGATGTIKNTGGVTRFLGGFTNSGAFISDPADNHFTDLTISDTGYLVGGLGDRFIVTDDLLNSSARAANWNTSAAELIFQNGTDVHDFSITGADHAGAVGGFSDNFSWGTVRLAAGQSLRLQDGNATQGGALYVKNLVLEGGLSQVTSITGNGLNIYYDSLAPANAYLGEQTYNLQNGGLLAPMRSLDFDANGIADALTDGILAVRHLFGFTDNALINGVVDPTGLRTASGTLGNYLGQAQGSLLDVDGNGTADALSDGIVIIRYLFGFSGEAMITGVVDPAGTRTTAAAIEAFLAGFLPGSTAAASTQVSTTSASRLSVADNENGTSTADLSLAYVQRSWVKGFVAEGASLTDASEEEELLIALPS